jgi:hypothetical protein
MKVGVCGTGRMGSSIAERLISVGHEVAVYNRDAAKTRPLVDAGAKAFASPAELAEACDIVIVMLLNDTATETVYLGPNSLLKAKLAGRLVIDMSTIRPETMISVGGAVTQLGAAFVECPVGGSKAPAREGKLFGLVGGSKADVDRAMPALEQLCRRIEHVGPFGAGATLKLAVSPAARLLAGAWRSSYHLQATQPSARSADRYPVRHRRRAGCDERPRRYHRQSPEWRAAWRDRIRHHGCEEGSRYCRAVRGIPPCGTSGCEKRAGLL